MGRLHDEEGLAVEYPSDFTYIPVDVVDKLPPHPSQFEYLMLHHTDFVDRLNEIAPEYDLIFNIYPFWAIASNWATKTPLVTMIPDLAFDFINVGAYLDGYLRGQTRLAGEIAAATVFPANFHRLHAEIHYGFTRTHTIYHSADMLPVGKTPIEADIEAVRTKYGLPKRYVLAFHPMGHKGLDQIVQAQHYARSHSPFIPPLVIAGMDTNQLVNPTYPNEQMEESRFLIFQQLGAHLGQDIFITGPVEDADILPLHAGATVAVTASTMDGDVSGPMFDAMHAKTPLIAPTLPVYQERLSDKELFFYDPKSPAALGRAIMDVCVNGSEGRVEAAFLWSKKRTIKNVAADYLKLFAEVLAKN